MSLSPLSAIADMVAPVVLITLGVIFSNALLAASSGLADGVLALERERLGVLRGPHGEMLDEDSVPPIDRERVREIKALMPRMIKRIDRSRTAMLTMWSAIGLLVLSVAAIAAAATAHSEAFAFVALALVLAGVAGEFAAIATVIVSVARTADSPVEVVKRRVVQLH